MTTRKKTKKTKRSSSALTARLNEVEAQATIYEQMVHRQEMRLQSAEAQLAQYRKVLGPVWQTRAGYLAVPALMSDNHLNNIIEKGFGNETMREAVRAELKRRENDDDWHATEGKKSPRQMLKRLAQEVEQLKNRPADERIQNVIDALRELVR